jgi:hypothetical protein
MFEFHGAPPVSLGFKVLSTTMAFAGDSVGFVWARQLLRTNLVSGVMLLACTGFVSETRTY